MEQTMVLEESTRCHEVLQKTANEHEDHMEALVSCLELMIDKGHKRYRETARLKAKSVIRQMSDSTKENAVRYMTTLFSSTEDQCLQNYIADILLAQCCPEIDDALYLALESAHGRITPLVREVVLSGLGKNKRYLR